MNNIPLKPQNQTWNDDQWTAMHYKSKNLLVSAGAGAGKTAVLVQRIIKQLINKELTLDKLLVVTFTNAAAAEMKERIRETLEQYKEQGENLDVVNESLMALPNADITTFHAFCFKQVRKYYYLLNLSPQIKLLDDVEFQIIKTETLENLFKQKYKENDEQFLELVSYFNQDFNDNGLKETINAMFNELVKLPDANKWIDEILNEQKVDKVSKWAWYTYLLDVCVSDLTQATQMIESAIRVATDTNGPFWYEDVLKKDLQTVVDILNEFKTEQANVTNNSYEKLYQVIRSVSFDRLSRKPKGEEADEILQERVKEYRNTAKDLVNQILKNYFSFSEDTCIEHFATNVRIVRALADRTIEYIGLLSTEKTKRNAVNYDDLEHLMLELLTDDEIAKMIGKELIENFTEIMVDEYQDTNYMQEEIINLLSLNENTRRFMVGDIKQAIYRFRHATPKLFAKKYEQFDTYNPSLHADNTKVMLNYNYRSRDDIINATNYFFSKLMSTNLGDVDYNENAALKFGATYYPKTSDTNIRMSFIEKDKESMDTKQEREAKTLVAQIKQDIDSGTEVFDKKTKQMRKMTYEDVAVLFRSTTHIDTYTKAFKDAQIPHFISKSENLLDTYEVLTVLSYLEAINNKSDNVAIVGVLRSIIYKLTEAELATIKINSKKYLQDTSDFSDIIFNYTNLQLPITINQKLARFVEDYTKFSQDYLQGGVSRLLKSIYEHTYIYDEVLVLNKGLNRQKNLDLFYSKVASFESRPNGTLQHFVSYIRALFETGQTINAASVDNEGDAVTLMTFHKSKGLEFPCVYLVGLGSKFNTADEKAKLMIHKDYGAGCYYYDKEKNIRFQTLNRKLMKQKIHDDMLSEEMRLLYVAVTRAKEKLNLIISVDDLENTVIKLQSLINNDGKVSSSDLKKLNRAEWFIASALKHKDMVEFLKTKEINLSGASLDKDESFDIDVRLIEDFEITLENVKKQNKITESKPLSSATLEKLNFKYPHEKQTKIFSKTSIAKIKEDESKYSVRLENKDEASEVFTLKEPQFLQTKRKLTASEMGTAYHKFMQHLDYNKQYDLPSLELVGNKLVEIKILTPEEFANIELDKVLNWCCHPFYEKLSKSMEVEVEVPFTLKVSNEGVEVHSLLQGVIDVLGVGSDTACFLDFKTNKIRNDKHLAMIVENYNVQIRYYLQALKAIYPDKLSVGYLYFVDQNKLVEVDGDGFKIIL